MSEIFLRTEVLLGEDAIASLHRKHVAVFGIGGVGGYVCEALVRSGVGAFTLVDKDAVDITNLNRQIIATQETVGRPKTEVMRERMLAINPEVTVTVRSCFFLPENADSFEFTQYDYVVDAVDTVTAKLAIIMKAKEAKVPVISAMGAGNKLDATRFRVADISKTSVCPLAKVMRRELKKRGVTGVKVVYSDELPRQPSWSGEKTQEDGQAAQEGSQAVQAGAGVQDRSGPVQGQAAQEGTVRKKAVPGSVAFVPAVAGLIIAGEVVKDFMGGLS